MTNDTHDHDSTDHHLAPTARSLIASTFAVLLIVSAITASAVPVQAQSGDVSDDDDQDGDASGDGRSNETEDNEFEGIDVQQDDGLAQRERHESSVQDIHEAAEFEGRNTPNGAEDVPNGEVVVVAEEDLPEDFQGDLKDVLGEYEGEQGPGHEDELGNDLEDLLDEYEGELVGTFETDGNPLETDFPDGPTEDELEEDATDQGSVMGGDIDNGVSVRVTWGDGEGAEVDVKGHAAGHSTPWISVTGDNGFISDIKDFVESLFGGGDDAPTETGGIGDSDGDGEGKSGGDGEGEGESDGEGEDESDGEGDGEGDSGDEGDGSGEGGESDGEDEPDTDDGTTMPQNPTGPGGDGCGGPTMTCQGGDSGGNLDVDSGRDVDEECKTAMPSGPNGKCGSQGDDVDFDVDSGRDVDEECQAMMPNGPRDGCGEWGEPSPGQSIEGMIEESCKEIVPQDEGEECSPTGQRSEGAEPTGSDGTTVGRD